MFIEAKYMPYWVYKQLYLTVCNQFLLQAMNQEIKPMESIKLIL